MTDTRSDLKRMMPDAFPIFFEGRQPFVGQLRAMPEIVRGHSVLFAAPTASGKTEAAISPLFQRHLSFHRHKLSTIYVAPTKALVNDLYERLIAYLGTPFPSAVARYTGDRHEFHSASGVFCLLATPEALDSLQLRRPEELMGTRAVVIDEIHLLHGQARGQQLRHVIDRIKQAAEEPKSARDNFQLVGMTATLDDMEAVGRTWLGGAAQIVSHGTARDIDLQFIDVSGNGGTDPYYVKATSLARWINEAGCNKILVFANSRNAAHSLAAHLHQEMKATRWPVHLHFGVLAPSHRERVEEEMRSKSYGICIATSTLEIGIDIGDIDAIVLADAPSGVNAFLQRVGRGNRRSGICRVIAFRSSEYDEQIVLGLVDCARRGELDDAHEYDRHSVRLQQILSLCWRATRHERPLTSLTLALRAGTEAHEPVVSDMLDTGCLGRIGTALIPCDRLMDEGDAGRIHTVIAGSPGSAVLDFQTGDVALRGADEASAGGGIYIDGAMRRLVMGSDGEAFLDQTASRSLGLARIKAASARISMSRTVVWGIARQLGHDPTIWQADADRLITWGGKRFNTLLAALLTRNSPERRFVISDIDVSGPLSDLTVTLERVREWASQAQQKGDLPLKVAETFTNPTRFIGELSSQAAAEERRRSIPWPNFHRWLERISNIERRSPDLR